MYTHHFNEFKKRYIQPLKQDISSSGCNITNFFLVKMVPFKDINSKKQMYDALIRFVMIVSSSFNH